jgi:dTDP-4-dehydrorhamnose 3,5-epimerase
MKIIYTDIPGVLLIEPTSFDDTRGFFTEIYNGDRYPKGGVPARFVQDNFSRSRRGVLRGLHIQNPNPQGKLVTVLRGAALDIAIDVRIGSPTFGRHVRFELNDQNHRQLWIPRGFAHGFLALSEWVDFFYKCDDYYSATDELVIKWNDPECGVDWGISDPELSRRDSEGQSLSDVMHKLPHFAEF